jgi:hypothetical protein
VVRLVAVEVELRDMVDGMWREVLGESEVLAGLLVLKESEEMLKPAELVKLAGV